MQTTTLSTSNKQETQGRPRPIGGDFAFFEQDGSLEDSSPRFEGTGSLTFNNPSTEIINESGTDITDKSHQKDVLGTIDKALDTLDKITDIASGAVEFTGKATTDLKDAFSGLIDQLTVQVSEKKDPKIEQKEVEKKIAQQHIQKVAEVLEQEKARAEREEYNKMIEMALRMGVSVESLADKLGASHLKGQELLTIYYIMLGATKQEAEEKAAQKMQKDTSFAEAKQANGGAYNLDKVNEGGSVLSSTGGAGAG